MIIYITNSGSTINMESGMLVINQPDGLLRKIPKEQIDMISIFGKVQITGDVITHCLTNNILVNYFSSKGQYFGRLQNTSSSNIYRLKQQIYTSDDEEFALNLSKRIINAKVKNQLTILRRLNRENSCLTKFIKEIEKLEGEVNFSTSTEQLIGYEGSIAREYFRGLSASVRDEFKFDKRTRRPPLDPFNSLLSLGYTLLMHELVGNIESVGLNPYCGYLHKDRERHPTLASDLMEEFRPFLIDNLVVRLCNEKFSVDDFDYTEEGVFLKKNTLKIFLNEYEKRLSTLQKYKEDSNDTIFRRAVGLQCLDLVRAIENNDPELYNPIKIR